MKKISLVIIGVLMLVGCSFQESDLDKDLKNLVGVEEYTFKIDEDNYLGDAVDVSDGSVYFTDWTTDGQLYHGIRRMNEDDDEIIFDSTESGMGVYSFVRLNEEVYYSGFTLGPIAGDKQVGEYNYAIYKINEGKSELVYVPEDEQIVNPVELFVLKGKIFAFIQTAPSDAEYYVSIYNISDQKEVIRFDSESLGMYSDLGLGYVPRVVNSDTLVFATSQEKEGLSSTIHSFDGETFTESTYKGVYINSVIKVQDTVMFIYTEEAYGTSNIGFINKDDELIKTEIVAQQLEKVMDVKEGAIISTDVGVGENKVYQYVKIDGVDISFESISFLGNDYLRYATSNGYVAIDNSRSDKLIVKDIKAK